MYLLSKGKQFMHQYSVFLTAGKQNIAELILLRAMRIFAFVISFQNIENGK